MRKLVLSIAIAALFLIVLCHSALGGGSTSTKSDADQLGQTNHSTVFAGIREEDPGTDTSGLISVDGTVDEEEEIRESIDSNYSSNLSYTWEDEPIRAEVLIEDEDGLESVVHLVPIEDDDCNKIKFVPPAGIQKIKDILVIVDEDVDDEEEITIAVPEYVVVLGETLVVDADGFVIPELEVDVVPEDDTDESGNTEVPDDELTVPADDLTEEADDGAVGVGSVDEELVPADDLTDDGLLDATQSELDANNLAGDSGFEFYGTCSMVAASQANASAFIILALALLPIARKRK